MKILIKILFTLSFIFFNTSIFAQSENYQPAIIFDYQNNKIEGFIDYQDWRTNPTQIAFRETLDGTERIYLSKHLQYFTVAGNKYFSQNIIIEASNVRTMAQVNNLNDVAYAEAISREPVWDTISTFLEVLIEGEKGLFLYRDGKYRNHLFIENDGRYELLYYFIEFADAEKQIETDLRMTIVEHQVYKRQLSKYLQDCPSISRLIETVEYNRGDIMDIFKAYYDCKNQKIIYEKTIERDKVFFTVLAGLAVSDFNIISAPTYQGTYRHLAHGDYPTSKQFTGGAAVDLVLPGNFNRNIFLNEWMYKGFNIDGFWSQNGTTNIEENRTREFQLKMAFLKWNMQYRYKRQISPTTSFFLNSGISHNFGIERLNEMVETSSFFGSVNTYEYTTLNSLQLYHLGLIGGVGFGYKRFSGELRYEFRDDISELTIITTSSHNYLFIIGYRLN